MHTIIIPNNMVTICGVLTEGAKGVIPPHPLNYFCRIKNVINDNAMEVNLPLYDVV